jgi:hypothetical protein
MPCGSFDRLGVGAYTNRNPRLPGPVERRFAMRHRLLFGTLAAVFVALLPTTVSATTTYKESVAGIETGVPIPNCDPNVSGSSLSSFAGVAFGSLNGTFTASVCHTALSNTDGATILADHNGVFTLTNGLTTVGGGFTGGSITPRPPSMYGRLCIQRFSVSGFLNDGSFAATLTHYAYPGCTNVFFATVAGSATVNT